MTAQTVLMWRVGGGLYAADHRAATLVDGIAEGQEVAVRIMRGRSAPQNALYWRVLHKVIGAARGWRDVNELHAALKIAAGYVTTIRLLDGRRIKIPDSIAFDKMSEQDATVYYNAAFQLLSQEVLAGQDIEAFLHEEGSA